VLNPDSKMSSAWVISVTRKVFALVVVCPRVLHYWGEWKCCHDSRFSFGQVTYVLERLSRAIEPRRGWPACPPPLDLLAGS
jgi:hypothetical protein